MNLIQRDAENQVLYWLKHPDTRPADMVKGKDTKGY